MREQACDKQLNIKTGGKQKWFLQASDYCPYEPTPFQALEALFESYEMKSTDRVVDFGCGKGRLVFYLHYRFHSSVTGIEMNEALYRAAEENLLSYAKKHPARKGDIRLIHNRAEAYPIDPADNRFYFFHPFSARIFMKIIGNIQRSYEQAPRELELLLYYPSEDYILFLDQQTPFECVQEISLDELYRDDPQERFLIYRLNG